MSGDGYEIRDDREVMYLVHFFARKSKATTSRRRLVFARSPKQAADRLLAGPASEIVDMWLHIEPEAWKGEDND